MFNVADFRMAGDNLRARWRGNSGEAGEALTVSRRSGAALRPAHHSPLITRLPASLNAGWASARFLEEEGHCGPNRLSKPFGNGLNPFKIRGVQFWNRPSYRVPGTTRTISGGQVDWPASRPPLQRQRRKVGNLERERLLDAGVGVARAVEGGF